MQINPTDAAALQAVLLQDLEAIHRIEEHLFALAKLRLTREQIDSLGFALHNVYNALENSFSQISLTFENHVKDRVRWHRELLEKMFLAIPPVRPAVLPPSARSVLIDLLGFRHLFRHGYELALDEGKLLALARRWETDRGEVKDALRNFAERLGRISTGRETH
jgi:hypothetical protein